MSDQVKETGIQRNQRLKAEAKLLGITGITKSDELEKAIAAHKAAADVTSKVAKTDEVNKTPEPEKGPTGISADEAKSIKARLRYEDETREKIKRERQLATDKAEIIAESESLCIPIDLPAEPTELDLARARRALGLKKKEVKPSPETLAIESSKRGYYVFTNREQDDASHTVNLGGKYVIHLIPDQIHVLSEFHIKRWRKCAVTPEYARVDTNVTPSDATAGQMAQRCERVGGKPRFAFEYISEAPIDAPFGLVTDAKILESLEITS